MRRKFGAFLLALPLSAGAGLLGANGVTAQAEESSSYRRGSEGIGVIAASVDENVSVKETITFDLNALSDGAGYGTAEVQYCFTNAGEEAADITLLLPLGRAPEYETERCDYVLLLDGEEISARSRYTYSGGSPFSLTGDLPRLCSEYKSDGFYAAELPVTEYVFSTVGFSEDECAGFDFEYCSNPLRTRVAFSECAFTGVKNGNGRAWIPYGEEISEVRVYAFGEPLKGYEYRACKHAKKASSATAPIPATVTQTSFFELSMRNYSEASGILREDWYNGYIDMLNAYTKAGVVTVAPARFGEEFLMKWYEYNLTVPAGESVVNTVTQPLRPSLDTRKGSRYDYGFLLSPAQIWESYEGLEIHILTDYNLEASSLEFTQAGEEYYLSRNTLPQGELTFSVTDWQASDGFTPYGITPALTTALVMLGVIVVVAVVTVSVLVVNSKKKRRQKERAEAVQNGSVRQGKIDLEIPHDTDEE